MYPDSSTTTCCDQILEYMRYGEEKLEKRERRCFFRERERGAWCMWLRGLQTICRKNLSDYNLIWSKFILSVSIFYLFFLVLPMTIIEFCRFNQLKMLFSYMV